MWPFLGYFNCITLVDLPPTVSYCCNAVDGILHHAHVKIVGATQVAFGYGVTGNITPSRSQLPSDLIAVVRCSAPRIRLFFSAVVLLFHSLLVRRTRSTRGIQIGRSRVNPALKQV